MTEDIERIVKGRPAHWRIPFDDPARCRHEGHIWGRWGPYTAVMPAVEPRVALEPPERDIPFQAYRDRSCKRCGELGREDYYGNPVAVRDHLKGQK